MPFRHPPFSLLSFPFLEVILSLLTAGWLYAQAQAMAPVAGLGERYPPPPASHWTTWRPPADTAAPAATPTPADTLATATRSRDGFRAVWLRHAAPVWLPAWVLCGGLALAFARAGRRAYWPVALALVGSLAGWLGWELPRGLVPFAPAGGVLAGYGHALGAWTLLGALTGLGVRLAARLLTPHRHAGHAGHALGLGANSIAQALLWPIFALLAGLSWLAIADFAAGGDPSVAFIGNRAADGLPLATAVAVLAAAAQRPIADLWLSLAETIARTARTRRGRLLLLLIGTLLALTLGWLGRPQRKPEIFLLGKGLGLSHVSGEALRLFAVLALGWLCYRRGEWGMSEERRGRLRRAVFVVLFLVSVGLTLSADNGPGLVIALLIVISFALLPLKWLIARRAGWLALLLAASVSTGAAWIYRHLLTEVAPVVSSTAADRKLQLVAPQFARHDDLLRLHWLIDAAPLGGFAPGQAPWCGAAAQIGEMPCLKGAAKSRGAPLQTPEDFAFVLWATYHGLPLAFVGVVLLVVWLGSLLFAATPRRWPRPGDVDARQMADLALFWLVAIAALSLLAQTLVALGGTLRWSPLTGMPLPLFAHARTHLALIAALMGLAQGAAAKNFGKSEPPSSRRPSIQTSPTTEESTA